LAANLAPGQNGFVTHLQLAAAASRAAAVWMGIPEAPRRPPGSSWGRAGQPEARKGLPVALELAGLHFRQTRPQQGGPRNRLAHRWAS